MKETTIMNPVVSITQLQLLYTWPVCICECSPSLQMFGTYTQTYSFRSLKTFTAHHMHTLKIKKNMINTI